MFEHSLIGLAATKPSRRRWLSLPAAILLHLGAFAIFTFASYWQVEAVPAPPTNDVFFVAMAPPPPPPPLGSGRPEKPEARPDVKPDEVKPPQQTVQPRQTADLDAKPRSESPVVDDVAGLPPGGDPRGSIHGVDGGDPNFGVDHSTGPVGPAVPTIVPVPADSAPIQVGGAVTRPEVLVRTQPRYTEQARKAHVEGVVILRAVIDERGYVTDVQLVRGQPMGLDLAAMEAVRTWRFKPATLHDRPVKVYFNLTVNFTLQR